MEHPGPFARVLRGDRRHHGRAARGRARLPRGPAPWPARSLFRGDATLYGRYWGCDAEYHSLHFETCYYQGIEHAIDTGLARFEPGAQGEHKIARGFLPTWTRSAHWIAHPDFRRAIAEHLARERAVLEQRHAALLAWSPFRADGAA
ncbi:MAG: peptidogalycan biosysnthesis protein [Halofilum sp. (in: g-proteobacteria)]|nr:peptidogalycan biosysnthesis protein [Halofilum sp. (in: g-proteobacteria)]